MKLYILLVLVKTCYCSKDDEIYPVGSESKELLSSDYGKKQEYDQSRISDEGVVKIVENYENIGNQNKGNYGSKDYRERQRKYTDEEFNERLDKIFGYTGPTANDEPENLIRPCALDDYQCVRKYFAANSKCKPAYGPIPDPLYVDSNTLVFSLVNMTLAATDFVFTGLSSAKIREFYVNKKSGNLVFAIAVDALNQTSPRAYFRYRRTAKESIVLADFGTATFRSVVLTAVIPKVPDLRLDLADVHIDVQDPVPILVVGPGAAKSPDPDVQTAFTQFVAGISLAAREGFFFQSQLLTAAYIQKNICDFGLKLISI